MLVAPSLSESARRQLRDAGINHVDLEGHVYIREPGLRVWLDQVVARRSAKPAGKGGRQTNPFSKRASFVLRALLETPSRSWAVREIGSETGLSAGYTSDVLAELVQRGYAAGGDNGYTLADPVRALFDWMVSYRWDRNKVHSFEVPNQLDELAILLQREFTEAGIEHAFTLLSGTLITLIGGD